MWGFFDCLPLFKPGGKVREVTLGRSLFHIVELRENC